MNRTTRELYHDWDKFVYIATILYVASTFHAPKSRPIPKKIPPVPCSVIAASIFKGIP